MLEKIEKIQEELSKVTTLPDKQSLDAFRMRFISKKGEISALLALLREVPNEQKREFGQKINTLKQAAEAKFKELQQEVKEQEANKQLDHQDLTLPTAPNHLGTLHPITQVRNQITRIFQRMGFNISDGPEIEQDWYNFSALNFPDNHPAREMQDTFFVEKDPDVVLRTHTSNVQIRLMEQQQPPLRSIMPGRVFRNEAISARAHCLFHQIEGLYVDKDVSFLDMKNTLYYFAKEMFGADTKIRLRPSYFPFTEPSAEMDIYWGLKTEADYRITKGTGWLEIMGCGMVDPNVLKNCGVDPDTYTGFAFGMGIERIAMLKYKIEDIRLLFENDVRFLRQFEGLS